LVNPRSAEKCALHMPSLPAAEPGEFEVATAAMLRGNTLTNSIRTHAILYIYSSRVSALAFSGRVTEDLLHSVPEGRRN